MPFLPSEGILFFLYPRLGLLLPHNPGLCPGEVGGQVGRGDLAHLDNDLVGQGHQLPVDAEGPLDPLVHLLPPLL